MLPELFNIREKLSVDQKLCLNNRCRTVPCSACAGVCPHHSVTVDVEEGIVRIGENCSGCGLCVAACPTRAISRVSSVCPTLPIENGVVDLVCTKLDHRGFVPCLAMLDVYALVYIALHANQVNVIMDDSQCEACHVGVMGKLQELISTANDFLAQLQQGNTKISVKKDTNRGSLSRRDLFKFCFSKVKDRVIEAIPFSADAEQSYRQLVLKVLPSYLDEYNRPMGSMLFWGAVVSQQCDLCGVCVRACKNEALTIKVDTQQHTATLYHNQSRCIGCSVCSYICPTTAINIVNEDSSLEKVASLLPNGVVTMKTLPCHGCGIFIIPNEQLLCEECRLGKKIRMQAIY